MWNAQKAKEAVLEAMRARGLRSSVELIHFTKTAVFSLPEENLVAKVSRPGAPEAGAGVELAEWLWGKGAPVPRPAVEVARRPLRIQKCFVHFWERESFAGQGTSPELGELLRGFHELSAGYEGKLPRLDPFPDIDRYLLQLRGEVSADDIQRLQEWRDHLRSRWGGGSELGEGPLHGNAHRGNTALAGKRAFLLDWDLAAWGPREWDLLPETLGPRRYGRGASDYELFARSYGYDVLRWPGFSDAVLVRELLATLFRLLLDSSPQGEGQRRLAYWKGESGAPLWRGF